jgi:hypothetical protein
MRRVRFVPVSILAASLAGCYSFDVPLGPATTPIEKRLLGDWRCLMFQPDSEDHVLPLRFRALDENRYEITHPESPRSADTSSYHAHITPVKGRTLFNFNEVQDGQPSDDWIVLRTTFLQPNVLRFELADPDPFEKIEQKSEVLLKAFEERQDDADVFRDLMVCLPAPKPAPGEDAKSHDEHSAEKGQS